MKAVKGVYENGSVKLAESLRLEGPVDVVVVFGDEAEDGSESFLPDEKKKEILEYFRRRRMEMPPLDGSVSKLVHDRG